MTGLSAGKNLKRLTGGMLLVLLTAGGGLAQAPEPAKKWSVLLITVDCLRPDHMSVYGYGRDTTPRLAEFAKEALVFENAFGTSAWTVPGLVSLITGYYPPVHGQSSRFGYYDKEMPTPLRVLAAEGYDIFGTDIKGPGHEDFGYQGKPAYDRPFLEKFIEERAAKPKPFFTWVHLDELHLPYTPSEKNASRWIDTSRASPGIAAVREHRMILRSGPDDLPYKHIKGVAFQDDDRDTVRALYDGELADLDERLGAALGRMRENGLLDRTVVVITADHGEELLDHGWVGHASTSYDGKLYDELIRIPLIIRLPDRSRTGRFSALVQGIDLMPTLLPLLGVDPAPIQPPMQGRSLVPVIAGERPEVRTQLFAVTTLKGWTTPEEEVGGRVFAVRTKDRKLLDFSGEGGRRIEAYDLRKDPGEKKNLFPARARKFADLERALVDWKNDCRETAARLVEGAAQKRQASLEKALAEGDLIAAVREWEALQTMHQTWGLEPEPFYSREPHATAWKENRRQVGDEIATALQCESRGTTFRFLPATGAAPATVACPE